MHNEKISYLLKKYLDNSITAIEWRELMELLSDEQTSAAVRSALEELIDESPALADYQETEWEHLYQKTIMGAKAADMIMAAKAPDTIMDRNDPIPGSRPGDIAGPVRGQLLRLFSKKGRVAVAAAVLILFAGAGGAFLYRGKGLGQPVKPFARQPIALNDVSPGGNRAVLTLSDGSTIDLDGAKDGLLVRQGGSRLVKQNGGQLAYTGDGQQAHAGDSRQGGVTAKGGSPAAAAKGTSSKEIQYNLLTTPRGGQYQLILPDGSKVWLNAASSLRYPATFTGKERAVELKGEAYFEIAKNAAMPFRVMIAPPSGGMGGMQVDVLGTQFNVKAYADEPAINTTLLEGAVSVRRNRPSTMMRSGESGEATIIRPGEQAKLNGSGILKVETADTEEAVAWKNGLFRFNEATIEEVMRQLSRWYDVEVVYVNEAPKDLFRGEIYRNVNVSKVLKVLEASGVHFTVEGKKILVQS